MIDRTQTRIKAILTAALGFFLVVKVIDGTILFYINQRFIWLVLVAGIIMIIAAQVVFRDQEPQSEYGIHGHPGHEHEHAHPSTQRRVADLGWMLVPLMIGFLVPARPLSAGAITSRGLSLSAPVSSATDRPAVLEVSPQNRTILEWVQVFTRSADPGEFEGQPVQVSGFVFRDHRLAPDQIFVGRFIITCCAADAMAVGLVVQGTDASAYAESSWVNITGTMSSIELDGDLLPYVISNTIEAIPEPLQPYLYP